MGYYSFEVVAPYMVGITKPLVCLDKGLNVFSVAVSDVESFVRQLQDEGVKVLKYHCLDAQDPVSLQDLLTSGVQSPESVKGLVREDDWSNST